ncbi:hypothetical protein QUA71_21700 [Microcoleus sp. MON1_C5]
MPLVEFLKQKFDIFLTPPKPKGLAEDEREMLLSEMVPYTVHYDDETVITKDDGLVQVIKIDGLHFESYSAEQIKQFERRRNTVLRSIASPDRAVYVHLIRRKISEYPSGEGETWFAKTFNTAWKNEIQQNSFYKNDIYISVVRNRFRQGVPGFLDRIFATLTGIKTDSDHLETFQHQAKDLNEATNFLCQTLANYGARKLSVRRLHQPDNPSISQQNAKIIVKEHQLAWTDFAKTNGEHDTYTFDSLADFIGPDTSELGEFLSYLVNLQPGRIPLSDLPIDQTIANSWVDCNPISNVMAVQNLQSTKACAVLSMAEWPNRTSSRMLDEFLRQPVEFILTQSFFFTDRISAEHDLRQERRRIDVNDSDGASEGDKEEITKGLEELKRGQSVNGLHHLSILIHVDAQLDSSDPLDAKRRTFDDLEKSVGLLKKCFVNLGVKPVREWFAMETFYWSQLPGQSQHFIGRRGKIKSSNFAGFASLHNYASGRLEGNLWGPAIMSFPTESGTPYHFNFHRELEGMVAGHTAFTADTGSGKTTLLSALIAMADKAKPRVFWFDNRHGAKVFMCAMGGQHTTLTVQGGTGWNPFKLPDTLENRSYLIELLTLMRTCYGGSVTPDDIERFKKAVQENYALPLADRRLRNIAWCFGQGELSKVMRVWHGGNGNDGANWGVFDNETDNIDLSKCRHYCYEMQQLIKDGTARPELAVVLSYPFHRIEQAMNGEPFVVVLEEGQNLVKHEYWRSKIDSYIMQIRRKNGLLIFVTPDPKYIYCETDSIQKQSATKIFLPNSEARKQDYMDQLGLTHSEFEFIRDTPPEQRTFLIRRGQESVRAKFDLSALSRFIPVLSSNDKAVALMEQIIHDLKDNNPEKWVPIFMEQAIKTNTHNLKPSGVNP